MKLEEESGGGGGGVAGAKVARNKFRVLPPAWSRGEEEEEEEEGEPGGRSYWGRVERVCWLQWLYWWLSYCL